MLNELIPDPSWADRYVSRTVHGGHTDIELLDWSRMVGDNVLLKGPTGPGKTALCKAYCAMHQIPFAHINPGTAIEPSMLTGKEKLVAGTTVWVDGILTAALRHGNCVILLDELNFWPPGVTGFLHSLTDDQRYIYLYDHLVEYEVDGVTRAMPEVVRAQEGTLIVAAYNPDYEGTFRVNQAFENRFGIHIDWDYSPLVEEKLISLTTLQEIASKLRKMFRAGEITVPISTNRLMQFQKVADDLGLQAAVDNFQALFEGSEYEAVKNVFEMHYAMLADEVRAETGRDPLKGRFVV